MYVILYEFIWMDLYYALFFCHFFDLLITTPKAPQILHLPFFYLFSDLFHIAVKEI